MQGREELTEGRMEETGQGATSTGVNYDMFRKLEGTQIIMDLLIWPRL